MNKAVHLGKVMIRYQLVNKVIKTKVPRQTVEVSHVLNITKYCQPAAHFHLLLNVGCLVKRRLGFAAKVLVTQDICLNNPVKTVVPIVTKSKGLS